MSNRSKRMVVEEREPRFLEVCVEKWRKGCQRGARWDKVRAVIQLPAKRRCRTNVQVLTVQSYRVLLAVAAVVLCTAVSTFESKSLWDSIYTYRYSLSCQGYII